VVFRGFHISNWIIKNTNHLAAAISISMALEQRHYFRKGGWQTALQLVTALQIIIRAWSICVTLAQKRILLKADEAANE